MIEILSYRQNVNIMSSQHYCDTTFCMSDGVEMGRECEATSRVKAVVGAGMARTGCGAQGRACACEFMFRLNMKKVKVVFLFIVMGTGNGFKGGRERKAAGRAR